MPHTWLYCRYTAPFWGRVYGGYLLTGTPFWGTSESGGTPKWGADYALQLNKVIKFCRSHAQNNLLPVDYNLGAFPLQFINKK